MDINDKYASYIECSCYLEPIDHCETERKTWQVYEF